jgi:hypothetical protein
MVSSAACLASRSSAQHTGHVNHTGSHNAKQHGQETVKHSNTYHLRLVDYPPAHHQRHPPHTADPPHCKRCTLRHHCKPLASILHMHPSVDFSGGTCSKQSA